MLRLVIACTGLVFCAPEIAGAAESILFSFPTNATFSNGAIPKAGLLQDAAGNLYGTASAGGAFACNCGLVFMLSPPATGGTAWTETILHTFQGYPNDGGVPLASLIFDGAGNLYGTTLLGGSAQAGTVFELSRPSSGQGAWTESIIYDFSGNNAGGQFPYSHLAFDTAGHLYGTSFLGGANNLGLAYELVPPTGDATTWSLIPLHDFAGGSDGANPVSGVTFDGLGNLYGTTFSDGVGGVSGGTLFQLKPAGTGFAETVLHTFTDNTIAGRNDPFDGGLPYGDLILDETGNIYGTTLIGGSGQIIPGESSNAGTVFKLSPPIAGSSIWKETLIHSFNGDTGTPDTQDGASPTGALIFDSVGNLYGTTSQGGSGDQGTVFELSPPAAGTNTWTQTVLHNFTGFPDGAGPYGSLLWNPSGTELIGVTTNGTALSPRSDQIGTVFELTP